MATSPLLPSFGCIAARGGVASEAGCQLGCTASSRPASGPFFNTLGCWPTQLADIGVTGTGFN
jgi:hypothetical protein